VIKERLWIILIESKKTTFDLELALPQTLAYMAATPNPTEPLYGLITNGGSHLFVKTLNQEYSTSDLFATRSPHRNNLCAVLQILKHLGNLIC
jgi:hypothetical protein